MAGAGHIGLQAFIVGAKSADRLQRISDELDSRGLLTTRREHTEWTAIVGRDPDGVAVVVTWHPGGASEDGWRSLDEFLYGIGQ